MITYNLIAAKRRYLLNTLRTPDNIQHNRSLIEQLLSRTFEISIRNLSIN